MHLAGAEPPAMIRNVARLLGLSLPLLPLAAFAADTPAPPVSERARKVHASAILFDGHNDLPWHLRSVGDMAFGKVDLNQRLPTGHTDIPRIREGGLKAQFWSVYIPSDQPNPARTVLDQIDLVYRMVERYPDTFAMAFSADDVERIAGEGKVASLIGIEGGVAIEDDLAMLRMFAKLGARYMTLAHNKTLDWVDAATDEPKHDGLSPFGERVVREMNRLGMLVDISHVSPATMADALRISKAPIIASHSSARALADHPRNVPDEILKELPKNGGVIMVNFYSGFIVPEAAKAGAAARRELRAKYPDPAEYAKAYEAWADAHPSPRGTLSIVADHIEHIIKVAGIDHVGIGSDFDGITSTPVGLEDVASYPRLTEELLRRGHSDDDVRKILGGNALRAFRRAGEVAAELQRTTSPEVDQPTPRKKD
ncbi:dipeptidase [Tundrisphaera sp. TA3]|uniref:dipeptidase n=1 Tax=Tundrisphaera sp. TA3 TaxID=3435775 RepID=UPI003EB73104